MNYKLLVSALLILLYGCQTENQEIGLSSANNLNTEATILKELEVFIESNNNCIDCNYQIAIDKQSDSLTLIKFTAYQGVGGEFIDSHIGLINIDINGVKVEVICGFEDLLSMPQSLTASNSLEQYLQTKCFILNGNTLVEQSGDCKLFSGLYKRNPVNFPVK